MENNINSMVETINELEKENATLQAELEKAKELLNKAKKDIVMMSSSLYFDAGCTIEESEKNANNEILIMEITTFLEAK